MKEPGVTDTNSEHGKEVQDHRNLIDWKEGSTSNNLTIDMRFNEGHKLSIIVYSILFVFSAIANITILVLIVKRRRKVTSRINIMLTHLAIADLLVTFLLMPLEIGWAYTVSWRAGDVMCRIMAFFRIFGLFLSSFVLVCLSVDRYYAVLKPFHFASIGRRGRLMLAGAWIGAVLCSLPQSLIFHVEAHPNITSYKQCVIFHVIKTDAQEIAYIMFGLIMMYALPLIVIIFSYASILVEIFRRTKNPSGADSITRSSLPFLGKAKIRTLKMTIIIVFVFFICWTPYHVVCLWYLFDKVAFKNIDPRVQKGLFLFACTNSCMNPIVYGLFNIRARRTGVKVRPRIYTYPTTLPRQNNSSVPRPTATETRLPPREISLKSLEEFQTDTHFTLAHTNGKIIR